MLFFQKLMKAGVLVQDKVGEEGGGAGGGGSQGNEGGEEGGEEDDDDDKDPGKEGDEGMDPEKRKLLQESMSRKEKIRELNSQLESTSGEREELQTKLSDLEKKLEGIDLDKYQELVSQEKDGKKRKMAEEGKYEELEETIRAEADSRVEQVQQEADTKNQEMSSTIEDLQSQLSGRDSQLKSLVVDSEFGQSTYIRENLVPSPSKVQKIYGEHFEVGEDGKMVAYDKPKGAEGRTKIVDKEGKSVAFNEALQRIIAADPDKDSITRSKVKSGSDSKETNGKDHPSIGSGLSRIEAGLNKKNR